MMVGEMEQSFNDFPMKTAIASGDVIVVLLLHGNVQVGHFEYSSAVTFPTSRD